MQQLLKLVLHELLVPVKSIRLQYTLISFKLRPVACIMFCFVLKLHSFLIFLCVHLTSSIRRAIILVPKLQSSYSLSSVLGFVLCLNFPSSSCRLENIFPALSKLKVCKNITKPEFCVIWKLRRN
jgi:hypothetical protein